MLTELDHVALATELVYGELVEGSSPEDLPGFVVEQVFADLWSNTGFYAAALVDEANSHIVLAIRGSQDRLDFISNANLGASQYDTNRTPLIDYLGSRLLGYRVTLAGHSLGGGLSQYLAYDLALTYPAFRDKVSVHTHNGFGGILGITRRHGAYAAETLAGMTIRHFRHPNDPISRIGGQIGGRVLVLSGPDLARHNILASHANARFLPRGGVSQLLAWEERPDDPFDLSRTVRELGPDLAQALEDILRNRAAFAGLVLVVRLLRRLPEEEREDALAFISGLLPVGWLMRLLTRRTRLAGPVRPPADPPIPGAA